MSESSTPDTGFADASRDEQMSASFADLVIQHTNLALMMLGRVAHPETGQKVCDPDAARLFIDQLEMLETKTRGNLNKDEEKLLKQSLMTLRLAYVEATTALAEQPKPQPAAVGDASASAGGGQPATPSPPPPEEEPRKKFVKKY